MIFNIIKIYLFNYIKYQLKLSYIHTNFTFNFYIYNYSWNGKTTNIRIK